MLAPRTIKFSSLTRRYLEKSRQTLKLVAFFISLIVAISLMIKQLDRPSGSLATVYVSLYFFILLLGVLRNLGMALSLRSAYVVTSKTCTTKEELKEKIAIIQQRVAKAIKVLNEIFLYGILHKALAFLWGTFVFILAILLRPIVWNIFLFGSTINEEPMKVNLNPNTLNPNDTTTTQKTTTTNTPTATNVPITTSTPTATNVPTTTNTPSTTEMTTTTTFTVSTPINTKTNDTVKNRTGLDAIPPDHDDY